MTSVADQIAAALKTKVYDVQADLVRETAIRAAGNIAAATPVGNPDIWKTERKPKGYVGGRARANWNLSAETPDLTTTESTSRQSYDGDGITGQEKTLYVSNGLPYIERLNEGSSVQAPANFVEQGVMLAKRQAKAAALRKVRK